DFFRKRDVPIFRNFPGVFHELDFTQATSIGVVIVHQYVQGGFDRIFMVYNEFKNIVQQRIVCEQLLPLQPHLEMTAYRPVEYIYEPSPASVLDQLLPRYVNIQIWRMLLESYAAEQAARMSAMDNATKNAKELVSELTLQFNKARQAAITKELLEIVSGAESLKG
ncbi:MAG: FoF1 ATP synthase subunit gamma, partial [Calditrichota bacterium]